ncbi:unnamed protein product [Microthlaspi erraticum]|uniref:Arabidopsis retrotransposon Orf1 C-terminal domain-containing protein n=1 Tax=Microthlaspi erraticum TaxID=1685480 RepID=A0A6D2IUV1_9BRAS|nr:unnamed protein product [Microthlaspi erraticum]
MWSWCSRTCTWPSSSLTDGVYKELTCEFLASMRYHMSRELDRADWTKDWDGSRSWQGREEMVTFRQLGDLFGFTMERESGTSRKKNSKEFGLQSLMECTLPQGPRLLRSGAQCLRYVHKALANTFFARKATGQSMRREAP